MSKFRITVFTFGFILCSCVSISIKGNNISIHSISIPNRQTIKFYINWEHSWNYNANISPKNHDAAWVFIKYKNGNEDWKHLKINSNSNTHISENDSLLVQAVNDELGVFIRKKYFGESEIIGDTIQLNLSETLADGNYKFMISAIEMVFVPNGAFFIGDSLSNNTFSQGASLKPYQILSENAIMVGSNSSELNNSGTYAPVNHIPSMYPKGFQSFYMMKYEISQEQYKDFLNTLTFGQQQSRTSISPASSIGTFVLPPAGSSLYRNGIAISKSGNEPNIEAIYSCNANSDNQFNSFDDGLSRACNFLSWSDLCAYLDWSGLRPMTEFEFEKACRGVNYPTPLEFAFGSINVIDANTLIDDGKIGETVSETATLAAGLASHGYIGPSGPIRCGFGGKQTSSRLQSGTSYYGIFELSGNLWEMCVSVNQLGLEFIAINGDGYLDINGNSDIETWKISGLGSGYRGGAFESGILPGFRDLAISDRFYAGLAANTRRRTSGGRGVRNF